MDEMKMPSADEIRRLGRSRNAWDLTFGSLRTDDEKRKALDSVAPPV